MSDLREIDRLIHQHIFQGVQPLVLRMGSDGYPIPFEPLLYSSQIAAAWQVVERMATEHEYGVWATGPNPYHYAVFEHRSDQEHRRFAAEAASAPLAICLAALKAHGVAPALAGEAEGSGTR